MGAGDAVFAIGIGRTEFNNPPNDKILRHGFSRVLPFSECGDSFIFPTDPASVICAKAIFRKSVNKGDSGGPLFRSSDGALIGITSFASMWTINTYTIVEFQVFTNIAYYNEWIARKTGLPLPNCYSDEMIGGRR